MGTTWFTSDLHLSHKNIINYCDRPFSTIGIHDDVLIANWNDRVEQGDVVWVLGDFTLSGGMKHGLERLKELKGRKRLVAGNHDPCWVGRTDACRYIPRYIEAGFEIVTPWARAKLGQHSVNLSHFPYAGDSQHVDRYAGWRLRPSAVPLLHGHTHSRQHINRELLGTIQIHVGVDAWDYAPVASHTLEQVLNLALAERRSENWTWIPPCRTVLTEKDPPISSRRGTEWQTRNFSTRR